MKGAGCHDSYLNKAYQRFLGTGEVIAFLKMYCPSVVVHYIRLTRPRTCTPMILDL